MSPERGHYTRAGPPQRQITAPRTHSHTASATQPPGYGPKSRSPPAHGAPPRWTDRICRAPADRFAGVRSAHSTRHVDWYSLLGLRCPDQRLYRLDDRGSPNVRAPERNSRNRVTRRSIDWYPITGHARTGSVFNCQCGHVACSTECGGARKGHKPANGRALSCRAGAKDALAS